MRNIIQNLDDITESREMLESKPNKYGVLFLYILLFLLIATIMWSYFSLKEVSIRTVGTARLADDMLKISNIEPGIINKINFKDGDKVKIGEVIYEIEHESLLIQKNEYEKNLTLEEKEKFNWEKLIKSIKDNKNYFYNHTDEVVFYNKFTNYKQNINDIKKNKMNSIETYKSTSISNANDEISNINKQIQDLNLNITLLNKRIDNCIIKAQEEGIVSFKNEISIGNYIQIGIEVANIIPDQTSKYKVEFYILNKDIGNIKEGDQIKLALPQQDFEAIDSKITKISTDAVVNKNDGNSYYIAETYINNKLINHQGNGIEIRPGMNFEVRIITERVKYLNYFLKKINLLN